MTLLGRYFEVWRESLGGGEAPVYDFLSLVALMFQGRYLPSQSLFITDSTLQTLLAEDTQLYLRHPFGWLRTGFSQLPCFGV